MKKIFKFIFDEIMVFLNNMKEHHTSAYAANAAYFFILSFIPLIMLLMSLIHYTNLTQESVVSMVAVVLPKSMHEFVADIIDELYQKTAATVSLSALVTLWSAGKGFMALKNGMQAAISLDNQKNYFIMRFTGMVDTLIFMAIILLGLALDVFGKNLENMIESRIEFAGHFFEIVVTFRKVIMLAVYIFIFSVLYKFIPDWNVRKDLKKSETRFFDMLPGATMSAVCWQVYSSVFSMYMHYSTGFSNMYGSLAVVIGIMMWLYGCMYLVLLGLEMNLYYMNLKRKMLKTEKYGKFFR